VVNKNEKSLIPLGGKNFSLKRFNCRRKYGSMGAENEVWRRLK
jgi:hypothetical protein